MKKITKKQYDAARKIIYASQKNAVQAMRAGNQKELDETVQSSSAALSVIADYKNQKS